MPAKNINVAELQDLMAKNQVCLIDVREVAEHAAQSIPGATLIPLGEVCCDKIPQYGDKKLVIHCRSGKRSLTACEKLLEENPQLEVYNLEGGIIAWDLMGGEVKKSDGFFLPIDQQTQLTIGLAVFLGSVLGYFVSAKFFLLSGFFGAGLIFAGLSGSCLLANLIAKMPWNQGKSASKGVCRVK